MLQVENTQLEDLDQIFQLFDQSITYQERHGYPVWKNYDKDAIINDIKNKKQYKVTVDEKMAIAFSVRYDDKIIWREMDNGTSIYLHRIVVNPEFKGKRLFGSVLEWAIEHSKENNLKNIRMDTWADNPNIIQYYQSFGFKIVENFTTPDTDLLPVHNRKLALTLLEHRV